MDTRPRTKAGKKRQLKIREARRKSKIKNLGIPIGAKSNKATH